VENARSVLDIGTGTGILALMLAQRKKNARIHGIEPDHGAVKDAAKNFASSPWADRLSISQELVQHHHGTYDTIITNPPYYSENSNYQNVSRAMARGYIGLRPQELISSANKLLDEKGVLHIILPVREGSGFIDMAARSNFFPSRHCLVYGKENTPKRRLITFQRQLSAVKQEEILIRRNGYFTKEYISLTKQFYINLPGELPSE
jgi:tRNA1Val (adenine37-N6)-methyltransferase